MVGIAVTGVGREGVVGRGGKVEASVGITVGGV